MKLVSRWIGLRVAFAGALASCTLGCGAGPTEDEELGISQEAITFGGWQAELTGKAFSQYGPALLTKKTGNATSSVWWALTVPYDNVAWRRVRSNGAWFGGWDALGGGGSIAARPATVTWPGPTTRNAAIALVNWSGIVKVGVAPEGAGVVSTWTDLSVSGFSTSQPALAFAGNYLYLFVKKNSDNQIWFKRNLTSTSGYNPANWSAWQMIPAPSGSFGGSLAGGVAAAAVSNTRIVAVSASSIGGTECLASQVTISGSPTAWSPIAGCTKAAFSIPSMTSSDEGNGGGRMAFTTSANVVRLGSGSANGTTWSFTNMPADGCVAGGIPAITQLENGTFVLATTCNGSENMSWRHLTAW